MNFLQENTTTVFVTGDDAELVRAAEQAEVEMRRRTEQETPKGLISPVSFAETEQEKALLQMRLALEKRVAPNDCYTKRIILVPKEEQPEYQNKLEPTSANMLLGMVSYPNQGYIPQHPTFQERAFPRIAPPSPRLMKNGSFRTSDLNLEKLFVERMRVCRVGSTIYMHNNEYYQEKQEHEIKTAIRAFLRDVLQQRGDVYQIDNVATLLRSEPEIEVVDIDEFNHLICMENGVLNLQTMELLPHSPQFFLTWQLKARYDLNAVCPVFQGFLKQVSGGDPDLIQRILEAMGYILLAPGNEAKRFFVLQGKGDTGKSVLGSLISSFYDESLVGSVDALRIGDRFSLSALVGKRLNIAMDLTDAALKEQSVAILKQITGNDLVTVEQKYHDPYAAKIRTKIVFGTNHILRVNSNDKAFTQRVMLIPFQYPVPKERQDIFLLDKLQAEKDGIFLLALQGYASFLKRGGRQFWGDSKFTLQTCQEGDEAEDLTTGITAFIAQCCSISAEAVTPTDMLHQHYLQFCQNIRYPGYNNCQQFSSAFGKVLLGQGISYQRKKHRVNGESKNCFIGIQLIEQ